MKKSFLLLAGLISLTAFTSCSPSSPTSQNVSSTSEKSEAISYFIGANVKELASMGHSVGGHMIILGENNKLDIHSGMFAAMAGSSAFPFEGTYQLDGEDLTLSYRAPKKDEVEYTIENTKIVNNDMFRAFLRTNGGMPNDETDPSRPGLNYYRLQGYELSKKVDTVYIASKVIDHKVYAYLLEITWDGKCQFVYRAGDKFAALKGTFEFKAGEGMESNYIALQLEGQEQRVSLSKPYLGFELKDITLPSLEAVAVITPEI